MVILLINIVNSCFIDGTVGFILVILFSSFDFWVTKNLTGRLANYKFNSVTKKINWIEILK